MIGVTEQAKAELKEILTSNVDDPRACLRIRSDTEQRLGVTIDVEMPGDQAVKYEGVTLLVVDEELADRLSDLTLDVEDSAEGRQLVIVEKPV